MILTPLQRARSSKENQFDDNFEYNEMELKKSQSDEDPYTYRKITKQFLLIESVKLGFEHDISQFVIDEQDLSQDRNILLQIVAQQLVSIDIQQSEMKQKKNKYDFINRSWNKLNQRNRHKNNQYQRMLSQQKFFCHICLHENYSQNSIVIPICSDKFCHDCFTQYLINQVITGEVLHINCPKDGCNIELKETFILNNLPQNQQEKFKKFKKIKLLSQDSLLKWCPRPECENFVRAENNKIEKLICICGQEICFRCGSVYHQFTSCENAFDKQYFAVKLKFKIYNCPSCKSPIQKSEGCNHMTCRKCKYEFCWLCRRKFSPGHYKEYNYLCGCPNKQYSEEDPQKCPELIFTLKILFLPFLAIFLLIILCLGIILLPCLVPAILFMQKVDKQEFLDYPRRKQVVIVILGVILGIITYPLGVLALIGGILFGIGYLVFLLIKLIKSKFNQ